MIDTALQVALFGNQIVAIIPQRKVIHPIDLTGLVGWVQLADLVQCAQGAGPIARGDLLLCLGKSLLCAGEIGCGGQRRGDRGRWLVHQNQHLCQLLLYAREVWVMREDKVQTLFGILIALEFDIHERILKLLAELL